MQASLPALVAHQAIDVLCVIMSHGFRYHTINSLELERTIYDDLVQFPYSEQGHPRLDQVAQGLIQPHLESLQGWGINHITGQPVPVPHHPHRKKFFPYI